MNWSWPSAVRAHIRAKLTPRIRNRFVFAVLTTFYMPTIKVAMEWDSKYWPVPNQYIRGIVRIRRYKTMLRNSSRSCCDNGCSLC